MIGWLKIAGIVATFALVMGGYAFVRGLIERHDLDQVKLSAMKTNVDAAEAARDAAVDALKAERSLQETLKPIYIRAERAASHVATIDPKCEQGDLLVADFRAQLGGMRQPAGALPGDPVTP